MQCDRRQHLGWRHYSRVVFLDAAGTLLSCSPLPPSQTLAPTKLGDIDYASPGHGLLFLHANLGITFDLEAIRRAHPGGKPVRFLATAGNTEIGSEDGLAEAYADFWVLVNGQVRFRRREINKCSGVFPIALSIAKEDRFLTLVATDGGQRHRIRLDPVRRSGAGNVAGRAGEANTTTAEVTAENRR